MEKNRLEAFSGGVIAIVITIMVLELKVPHGDDLAALGKLWPVFGSYVLSFLYVGTYWNNHHHMLQASDSVGGGVLWANLHLLFWLSLMPFTTGWMGENHFSALPTVLYGANLFATALAYFILQNVLVAHHGKGSHLATAFGRDVKGKLSLALYLAGMALAWWVSPWMGMAAYWVVALMWLVPDRRMENAIVLRRSRPAAGDGPSRGR